MGWRFSSTTLGTAVTVSSRRQLRLGMGIYQRLVCDLEMPRTEFRLPKAVLSPHDVERVLKVPDTTTSFGLRDRAILEVFYSTGIRRNELCGLELTDIDF